MAYISENYKPSKKNREILARAWEHVQGVPYQPTSRWLFYRLLQEGFYSKKDDYKARYLPLMSRARHNFYGSWRPDTLVDDSREAIYRGSGYDTPKEWAAAAAKGLTCQLHRWEGQKYYVEVWFEAEAMKAQFKFYSQDVILRPFGGHPSIHYKWGIAKDLEYRGRYGLPIIILYFGDWDEGGQIIPKASAADIRKWCDVDFEFIRAGLNPGDEVRYNISENFEKPGAYQWEALA
jgi:hypothetical protein